MKTYSSRVLVLIMALEVTSPAQTIVLPNGREMQVGAWSEPESVKVPTDSGIRNFTGKSFDYVDPKGNPASVQVHAVVAKDGRVLVGPAHWLLASIQDRLIGVKISPDKALLLFASTGAKIPTGEGNAPAFEKLLAEFDAEYKASGLKEAARVDIRHLFPSDSRVARAIDITFNGNGITCDSESLTVILDGEDPDVGIRIKLSPDLKVIGVQEFVRE